MSVFGGSKAIATCEVCGNQYDKAFEVRMGGKTNVLDSFECAIQALAPTCAHCADQHGVRGVQDRGTPEKEQVRG